jgi:polyisoprenoid-binding protein YceI
MKKTLLLVAALLVAALPALAADTYKIDGAHSSANFTVKHMGISTVHGRFAEVSGTILFDAANPANSSVTATINAATINTDNSMRDKHLNSPDFFDSAKFPEIKFVSTAVKALGGDKYVAIGTLTIKDVTKQIEIPFTLAQGKGMKGESRLGVEATLTINRFDYHIAYDPTGLGVSKDVNIELSVEAVK